MSTSMADHGHASSASCRRSASTCSQSVSPLIHALPEGKHDLEKIEALSPEHIAWAVAFALCQPRVVNLTQIHILPLEQGYSS